MQKKRNKKAFWIKWLSPLKELKSSHKRCSFCFDKQFSFDWIIHFGSWNKQLDYRGNMPNIWHGVPQEVLDEMGLSYDPAWIAKCIDPEKRNDIAVWDEEGNLLT
jgi:hypothetical protein